MAQLIDIRRVEIGPKYLTARVRISTQAPLMTSEDLEGTTRVYRLLPHIIEHVCLGDGGDTFKDVMGDTEIAHLLEHVTVEILAQSNIAGDIPCGRTYEVDDEPRTYDIEFPCPDDALVLGALSSAAWIMQWAFTGGGEPAPDVDATVNGLVDLVESLPEPPLAPLSVRKYVVEGDEARAILAELAGEEAPQVAPAYVQDDVQLDSSQVLGVPEWLDSIDEPEESVEPIEAVADESAEAPADEPVDEPIEAADNELTEAPADEAVEEAETEPAEEVAEVEEQVADTDDSVTEAADDDAEDDSVIEPEAEEVEPEVVEAEVIEAEIDVVESDEPEGEAEPVDEPEPIDEVEPIEEPEPIDEAEPTDEVELVEEPEPIDEVTYEDEPIEVSLTEAVDEFEFEEEATEPEATEPEAAEPEAEAVESVEAEAESVEEAPLPELNEPIIELDPVATTFDFGPEPEFTRTASAHRVIDDVIEVAPVEVAYTPELDPEDDSFDDLGSTMVTRPLVIDPVTGEASHQSASPQANATQDDPEDFGFDADMPTPKAVR